MDAWVAHEAAGAPDDYYTERLLSQLDIYDKLMGIPARQKPVNDELELRRQTRQIQHEADIRNGWI